MKVYIPFNSNDFNSVFTTLSISPTSFYPSRRFSFKRASTTLLNKNEDFLIGYENPIFHSKDNDVDYGLPILLEIAVDKSESDFISDKAGIRYLFIEHTLYLVDDFKLLFRSQKELDETLFKSMKSIETKFTDLAKRNSKIVKEDCYMYQLPQPRFPNYNTVFTEGTFYHERKLNKVLGLILGSSIAYSYVPSKELQDILILLKYLRNSISIYLNNISDEGYAEKNKSIEIIDKILKSYEKIQTLDESVVLHSNMTSGFFLELKNSTILGVPVFELITEGLLSRTGIELPLALKLKKLKRRINTKQNSKYSNSHVENIQNLLVEVENEIRDETNRSRTSNQLCKEFLVTPFYLNHNEIKIELPENLLGLNKEYLQTVLFFFINNDTINDVDTFFVNRKEILIELANCLKSSIPGFEKSSERDYLIQLLKSFENLRNAFNISATSNEVLKSIAILFTSGRDIYQFIEINEKESVQTHLICYTLWGAIYGAAALPKTLTKYVTEDTQNLSILVSLYKDTIASYSKSNRRHTRGVKSASIETGIEKPDIDATRNLPISTLANEVLAIVKANQKVKLTELVKLSKIFKKQADIESLIKEELVGRVKITRAGRALYAEEVKGNVLFD